VANNNSRQRRTNQNRAKRDALAARTGGVAKRPSRIAPATAEKLAKGPRSDDAATTGSTGDANGRSGARRERPPRPGDRPVDIATLEGNGFRKLIQVPGGMQVLMALPISLVIAFMVFTQKLIKANPEDKKPTLTLPQDIGTARAAVLVALPVLAAVLAVAFGLHKQRRRVWIGAAMVVAATILLNAIMFQFLIEIGMLVWAVLRSQRIEGPQRPPRPRRGRKAAVDGDADEAAVADEALDTTR
jgi:hypothetical protein